MALELKSTPYFNGEKNNNKPPCCVQFKIDKIIVNMQNDIIFVKK